MTKKKVNQQALSGWVERPDLAEDIVATWPHPIFGLACGSIKGSGKGKVVMLNKYLEKALGHFPIHAQTIGDCVSHGWALGVDILKAVEIHMQGEAESFGKETATEPIYASSRVEVGGGRLGSGDGSLGAWAAQAVRKYGTLQRQQYPGFDLRQYSGTKAKNWGRPSGGMPDELEPIAREHLVRTTSLVTDYDEARDAIANGFPVPVCSNQGFRTTRDKDGFAKPSGSWAHCMVFIGVDDESRRPGLLCMNSWGPDWINGKRRHGQPDGSFWCDADVVDKMLRGKDSYAMSGFEGYPKQSLEYMMI